MSKRSKFIALKNNDVSISEIATYFSCHTSTVKRWINRFLEKKNLHDLQRSGHKLIFKEEIQLKITAFFCQKNQLPGCNRITLKWASDYFKQNPSFLGKKISIASISRILRNNQLRPHLHKYFLQITDPNFFEKMELLISLYINRPKFLFCFDECPGIQALKRLAPQLPLGEGKNGMKYSEPNYNRKGTTDLYGFLDVNTGKVFGECTENHKVETLIKVFKKHFEYVSKKMSKEDKEEKIYYICDNLSNHSCHEFCKIIGDLCSIEYPEKKLDSKEKRQEWLMNSDKKIVFRFTPKHGSWLNMVEIWFGIMNQKCIKHNSFNSVEDLVKYIREFIETWNTHYAHPFNWNYKGEDLYNKAVHRFAVHLLAESSDMDISFLVSQLELMLNLINSHFGKVDKNEWKVLCKIIDEKKEYVEKIITKSDKPRIKQKAQKIFPIFLNSINLEKINCQIDQQNL